jgi:hypothetical protein
MVDEERNPILRELGTRALCDEEKLTLIHLSGGICNSAFSIGGIATEFTFVPE